MSRPYWRMGANASPSLCRAQHRNESQRNPMSLHSDVPTKGKEKNWSMDSRRYLCQSQPLLSKCSSCAISRTWKWMQTSISLHFRKNVRCSSREWTDGGQVGITQVGQNICQYLYSSIHSWNLHLSDRSMFYKRAFIH